LETALSDFFFFFSPPPNVGASGVPKSLITINLFLLQRY
jgi:hypothetical protein